MKRKFGILIIFALVIMCIPCMAAATEYTISTADDLITLRNNVNSGAVTEVNVKLANDIDLSGIDWEPIGSRDFPFFGTFDGNEKTISNLKMWYETQTGESAQREYTGLFGYTKGNIKNLNLSTVSDGLYGYSTTGRVYSGILAAYNDGNITNCNIAGSTKAHSDISYAYGGGVCGYNGGTISNTTASVDLLVLANTSWEYIYWDAYAGGIAGASTGIITNCTATANMTCESRFATSCAGGLVGDNRGGIITGCTSSGNVDSLCRFAVKMSYAYAGGLVGANTGSIKNSSSSATTEGSTEADADLCREINVDVGGLVGYNGGEIDGCSASGSVRGRLIHIPISDSHVGGLVGYNSGTVRNSFAEGGVSETSSYAGGVCGYNFGGTIEKCYATIGKIAIAGEDGRTKYAGGVVGVNENGTVAYSYAMMMITANPLTNVYAGGIAGNNKNGNIESCYYRGSALRANSMGGIAAVNSGSVQSSYVSTLMSGGTIKGGIASENYGFITDCYYDAKSKPTIVNGTEKTTAELKLAETYKNWRFEDIWYLNSSDNGFPCISETVASITFSGGAGTETAPYVIATESDLKNIRYALGSHYILKNDIVLTEAWQPIGNGAENAFAGVFDGNGHKISNLTFPDNAAAQYNGLIGYGNGCTVKNLVIEASIDISAKNDSVSSHVYSGGVIGFGENATVENCMVSGSIKVRAFNANVGGIAGYISGNVSGCRNNASVSVISTGKVTNIFCGGIAGVANGEIIGSASLGNVELKSSVPAAMLGGISGNTTGSISDSMSTGEISVTAKDMKNVIAGGISGNMSGNVVNSYTSASLVNGGSIAKQLYNGSAETSYYNNAVACEILNGTGVTADEIASAEFIDNLTINSIGGAAVWAASADNLPKPAYIKVQHIFENSLYKCGLVCDETANVYYKINDGAFVLYGSPFVANHGDKITYFAEAGGAQSEEITHIYYIDSTQLVYLTDYPQNQDGNVLTKDNLTDSSSVEINLNAKSDIESNVFVAFYKGETLIYAYTQPESIKAGDNKITVNIDDKKNTADCIKIFVWDGKLSPCAEVYIQN